MPSLIDDDHVLFGLGPRCHSSARSLPFPAYTLDGSCDEPPSLTPTSRASPPAPSPSSERVLPQASQYLYSSTTATGGSGGASSHQAGLSTVAPSLSVQTRFDDLQLSAAAAPANGTSLHDTVLQTSPPDDDRSPDPHEFYRPFQTSLTRPQPPSASSAALHHHPPSRYLGAAAATASTAAAIPTTTAPSSPSCPSTPVSSIGGTPTTATLVRDRTPSGTRATIAALAGAAAAIDNGNRRELPLAAQRTGSSSSRPGSRLDHVRADPAAGTPSTRLRQSSLKDLVDRFNHTQDESLPIPSRQSSRPGVVVPSRTISAAMTTTRSTLSTKSSTARSDARTSARSDPSAHQPPRSRSDAPSAPTSRKATRGDAPATTTSSRRPDGGARGNTTGKLAATVATNPAASRRSPKLERVRNASGNDILTSRSTGSLQPQQQKELVPSRQPLFGEIFTLGSDLTEAGFGIAELQRGGEPYDDAAGRPSLVHRRAWSHAGFAPSSPTAWYRSVMPAVAAGSGDAGSGDNPSMRPPHRRAQSEFTGVAGAPSGARRAKAHDPSVLPASVEENPAVSKQSSQAAPAQTRSRIPLSKRRVSNPSDSSAVASPVTSPVISPTRSDDRADRAVSPRQSSIPKPSARPQAVAAPLVRPVTPARSSSKRYNASNSSQRSDSSPRLKAYMSASLPKKSPPLRSSRPRLPISAASGTTPSAQARSEGVGSAANPRHPPHGNRAKPLGAADFAARRERIQRAFTKDPRGSEPDHRRGRATDVSKLKAKTKATNDSSGPIEKPARALKEDSGQEHASGAGRKHSDSGNHATSSVDLRSLSEADSDDNKESLAAANESSREMEDDQGTFQPPQTPVQPDLADSPTLGTPERSRHALEPVVLQQAPEPDFAAVTVTPTTDDSCDSRSSSSSSDVLPTEPVVETGSLTPNTATIVTPTQVPSSPSGLCLPATVYTPNPKPDVSDRESIQIMLAATPVVENQTTSGFDDNAGQQTGSITLQAEYVDPESSGEGVGTAEAGTTDEPQVHRQRVSVASDISPTASVPESPQRPTERADRPNQPADAASFLGQSHASLGNAPYEAIIKVLEHYHGTGLASPEGFRQFREQLLVRTPELGGLGEWDSNRITRLYLQHLSQDARGLPAQLSDLLKAPYDLDGARFTLPAEEQDPNTDIESDASGVAVSGLAHVAELSDEEWSSAQPSIHDEGGTRRPSTASSRWKDEWEDASPTTASWCDHPVVPTVPEDGAAAPPSLSMPRTPVLLPQQTEKSSPSPLRSTAASTESSRRRADREGALTPRKPTGERPVLPEIHSAGEGLGLSLSSDGRPGLLFLRPPPPAPDYSPPPPPPPNQRHGHEHSPFRESRRARGARSPPSPSIYSRHLQSTYPSLPPDEAGYQSHSTRTSHVSAQPPPIFTPSGPHTQSSASSLSREMNSSSVDHAAERVANRESASSRLAATPPTLSSLHAAGDATSPTTPEQRRLVKRKHLIKELIDTEKSFYTDMWLVQDMYKGAASNYLVLTREDVKVLFGNGHHIARFSMAFFDALKQAVRSVYVPPSAKKRESAVSLASVPTEDSVLCGNPDLSEDERDRQTFIGEIFCQNMAQMERLYAEYLKGHDAANKRLQKLMHDPAVAEWLEQCRALTQDLTKAWSLDSLLVKPVQRISKYSLILEPLLQVTPEDHPDFTALQLATQQMRDALQRMNENKRRVELVEQAVSRKRKESDVRAGLSKALGRHTEKLRRQVGLLETFQDPDFDDVAGRWHSNYLQLQLSLRDVERYTSGVHTFVDGFCGLIQAMEAYIDVSPSLQPELESKWRKFGMAMRELATIALPEHQNAVASYVRNPMRTLIMLYDGPQRVIQKRNKRADDYTRCRTLKQRGDKPDKRTQEHADQFWALNVTLKEELPKLYALTATLAEACLCNFVHLQSLWLATWQVKLRSILDDKQLLESAPEIVNQFRGDFELTDAIVLSFSICNGSALAELAHTLSPQPGEASRLSNRPSIGSARSRAISSNSAPSPGLVSPVDFGRGNSGGISLPPPPDTPSSRSRHAQHGASLGRTRGESAASSSAHRPADMPVATRSFSAATTATMATAVTSLSAGSGLRGSSSTGGDVDTASLTRPSVESASAFDGKPGLTTPSPAADTRPFSGLFSSAMSDSNLRHTLAGRSLSHDGTHDVDLRDSGQWNVLYVVASRGPYSVDPSITEAGYPFLSYVPGEIFDVVAEKGDRLLAKNQDDSSQQVGWIFRDHFAVLRT